MNARSTRGTRDSLNTPDVPPHVARQAIEWLLELQSGAQDEAGRKLTLRKLEQWLAQHPDHLAAWQQIERINQRLAGLSAASSSATVHKALTHPAASTDAGRRRLGKLLLLLAATGGGAWLAEYRGLFDVTGEERTVIGERRTLTLPEGSTLVLGTDTRVRLQYGERERRIELLQGEIMLTTAADRHPQPRPILVATARGTVQPLGTVFAVRHIDGVSHVDVFRDRVKIIPHDAPERSATLNAGQSAEFSHHSVSTPLALNNSAGAWAEGMIVASNTRLEDFVAELSRYRKGHLGCDPAVADLRISGTYPLADTERVLQILTASQPVELRYLTRYWVSVIPAAQKK
ncbi:FecR domain-containing protein [Herbaspirillum lusitanum]|uniref:FecR domain-containing protein n=1 Tax=Herbaspirillum lusitanum TaxID=213312 RepID=A0ABW9ADY3_9BURK